MQSDHILDMPSKYFEFLDDRPLTDETLEEMGFWEDEELPGFWYYEVKRLYTDALEDAFTLLIFGCSKDGEAYLCDIGDRLDSPRWKTVGSVRMLIETLKGDK